jgi:hypothetical protein
MSNMFQDRINRLYNRFMQRNANRLFKGVLKTKPIQTNPDSETILYSALDKTSCRQYITAVKSLLRFDNNLAVVAQSDGTLDRQCIEEIQEHLPGATVQTRDMMFKRIKEQIDPDLLKLIPSADEYNLHTSVKIMYLKFFNVIFQFNGRKVILIDSDILFLRKPEFILDWAKAPYTHDFYSEGSNDRAKDYHSMGFDFTNLDVANFNSGTIGVGGTVSQQQLIDIFSRIREYDASMFHSWEIEQALWSIVMASRMNPVNIDELREVYVGSGCRSYKELKQKAVIAHFVGAIRFNHLRYQRCARDVFRELRNMEN